MKKPMKPEKKKKEEKGNGRNRACVKRSPKHPARNGGRR